MGDRKQPRPVPTNQVRPDPPPPPPRKVDQVVEHHIQVSEQTFPARQHPIDRSRRRIDLLTGLFYVMGRNLDVSGDDLEHVIRDHVSKMVGLVPRFSDQDRESWSRALAIELDELLQRHASTDV
jgi:hypothetical protein